MPVVVPADNAAVIQAENAAEVQAENVAEVSFNRALSSTEHSEWLRIKPTAERILKGKLPLDSLTMDERELAARFYRATADVTVKRWQAEARLYNLERARYLEQGGKPIPPTLPDFIASLKKPGS